MDFELQRVRLNISKEDFFVRIRSKINQHRVGHSQWWQPQFNRLDYNSVQIKNDKLLIQKHFASRNAVASGIAGAVVEVKETGSNSIELIAKIYVDDSTRNFFKYFLAVFVFACFVLIEYLNFTVVAIFATIGIEFFIFVWPAIVSRETMAEMTNYFHRMISDISHT